MPNSVLVMKPATRKKFRRKLLVKVENAARKLIGYVRDILEQRGFPEAVDGNNYECAKHFMEFLMEAIENVECRKGAERLAHGILALNLDWTPEPIKNFRIAINEWYKYFPRNFQNA